MFGWLADMLLKSPVVGSGCPCCEGQKEQLKKMQKAILNNDLEEDIPEPQCSCPKEPSQDFEMTTTYHYEL